MDLTISIAAVVTGGASGLGKATVEALRARGVRVAIFDANPALGAVAAAETSSLYCDVDVTSDGAVEEGFAKAAAAHGEARILVNCAGIGNAAKAASRDRATGEARSFPMDVFDRVIQVNLVGTFRCIAHFARRAIMLDPFADGERGVIINTSSVAAEDGQIGQAAYAASKAGIVGLALPIARDLMGEGIRVNTILPGTFATPAMLATGEKIVGSLAAAVPFPKRLGQPSEYAALVLTMIENVYLNGAAVRLDGAIRMAPR